MNSNKTIKKDRRETVKALAAVFAASMLLLGIAGCAAEQDAPVIPADARDQPARGVAEQQVDSEPLPTGPPESLDLSMPDDFDFGEQGAAEPAARSEFDAGALFDKEEEKDLNVTVSPSLVDDDDPQALPRVDGGSVTIKKQTR